MSENNTDNRTTELKTLSKLKMAGRLRYWRGTIEIPEVELHAICDEIQAEHEQAIAEKWSSYFQQAPTQGNDRVTEQSIDKWLRKFQREHGELEHIGLNELKDLAYALHDDIPLGYEASMRLAHWLLIATSDDADDNRTTELESGTCEIESEFTHYYGGEGCDTYEFALSCGHSVEWLDCEPPRRCPTCGKKVKR